VPAWKRDDQLPDQAGHGGADNAERWRRPTPPPTSDLQHDDPIGEPVPPGCALGESKRPVVELPWSRFTCECQRFGHPPFLDKSPF
jgi:hypothetical protein